MEVLSSRVIIHARDFTRLRFFYEQVLGIRIYREYGTAATVTGVVYFLAGGFLELVQTQSAAGSRATLWLQVPDVAVEHDRLTQIGVVVRKPVERMAWGLIEAWFEDPEGNELRLVEVPEDHPLRRRVD
jgi:predicted enzyme related to lactoylglutathione lyase